MLKETLSPQELILDKLQDIRKVRPPGGGGTPVSARANRTSCFVQASLRHMNQTRFYIMDKVSPAVRVSLLLGGLPPLLAKEDYAPLLQDHLAIKSESGLSRRRCPPGLLTSCFLCRSPGHREPRLPRPR